MREPYRSLLVHERDMTPTLEQAYQRNISLRALHSTLHDEVLSRQVVLCPEGDPSPVLFGAIRIHLEHFPSEARRLVLEGRQPLGAILRAQGVDHTSRPEGYFQVASDATIGNALGLTGAGLLYGRRNVLSDRSQNTLAQVVEILPPANGFPRMESDLDHR